MGLFGLWNYEDYLIKLLVTSKFARNGLIVLLTYLMAALVRFHLSIILCVLFTFNNWFDLITPIIISVLVAMTSDVLYGYAETHHGRYEAWVNYFIKNYSFENFIRWKRMLLTGILVYILIGLYLVQIDNYYILLSIIQTTISFMICDFLEQRLPQTWYNYILNWLERPQITKLPVPRTVIRNYIPREEKNSTTPKQKKRRHSFGNLATSPKPSTTLTSLNPNIPLSLSQPRVETLPNYERVEILPPKPATPPMEVKSHYD